MPCTVHNWSKLNAGWGKHKAPAAGENVPWPGLWGVPRAWPCGGGVRRPGAALWSPARPGDQTRAGPPVLVTVLELVELPELAAVPSLAAGCDVVEDPSSEVARAEVGAGAAGPGMGVA